jgi:hypothetical protein
VQDPLAMSCVQQHILLAFESLCLLMLRVDISGPHHHNMTPDASILTVRELSLLSIAQPLSCICLVANRLAPPLATKASDTPAGPDSLVAPDSLKKCSDVWGHELRDWRRTAPTHCVLLRWGGLMSLLDMDTGSESLLFQVCHMH